MEAKVRDIDSLYSNRFKRMLGFTHTIIVGVLAYAKSGWSKRNAAPSES
jgi:hypothetical protein